MKHFPKLAAIAVLIHQDKTLLVRRKNEPDAGLWGFAGGHVEPGETALAAATRELFEETSIVAEPICYLTNIDVIERDANGKILFHFLLAAVKCKYSTGDPVADDDVADAQWVRIDDVFKHKIETSDKVDEVLRLVINS